MADVSSLPYSTPGSPDFRSDVDQLNSKLALQQDNTDLALAEKMAEEFINICGGVIKIRIRTDSGHVDRVWDEDVDPTYHDVVTLKGFFKTEPLSEELTKWGVDTPNKAQVVFSRAVIFRQFGQRMLRVGDLLDIPYDAISSTVKQYRVLNVSEIGRFKLRLLYLSCDVENITGDQTVRKDDEK